MGHRHRTAFALVVALGIVTAGEALAVMGGPTIIERVDTNGDHKLSLAEVRAAAGRRYDLIKSKNGGRMTMLQLGGRLVPADLKAIGGEASLTRSVSRDDYLALVDKFFNDAKAGNKDGGGSDAGDLKVGDLTTPAGKKLVGLLQ